MEAEPVPDVAIVDIHTHVFNAAYLPLEGILLSRGVPKIVAKFLSEFLLTRTKLADLRRSKDELLTADFRNVLDKSEEEARQLLFNMADVPHLTSRQRRGLHRYVAGEMPPARAKDVDFRALTDVDLIGMALEAARLDPTAGRGYYRYLALLLQDEVTIVRSLQSAYSVDRFVHHMMDMSRAYNDEPLLDFETEQIPRMQLLAELFPDRLLGFVAFDPFRRDHALSVVKAGIEAGAGGEEPTPLPVAPGSSKSRASGALLAQSPAPKVSRPLVGNGDCSIAIMRCIVRVNLGDCTTAGGGDEVHPPGHAALQPPL